MKERCVYLNAEPIGGIPELNLTEYGYECQCPKLPAKYNDDIDCDNCKYYKECQFDKNNDCLSCDGC